MDKIVIRRLTHEDLPFAAETMRAQKWFSQTPQELKLAIDDPACWCLLATMNGRECGLIMSRAMEGNATIANLIVGLDYRNQGIGKVLFQSVLDQLFSMNAKVITLAATEKWVSFFERFGFKKQERIFSFFGDIPPKSNLQVTQIKSTDLNDLRQLDLQYYQGDRSFYFSHYLEDFPQLALKFTNDRQITAYMFGQVGFGGLVFAGPMVSNLADNYEACALLQQFQENIGYQPFQLSTIESQRKWIRDLIEMEMKPNPEILYRMTWGIAQQASEKQYSLLRGPELIA